MYLYMYIVYVYIHIRIYIYTMYPYKTVSFLKDSDSCWWQDGVMGLIEIPNKDVDDFIILRCSDHWSTWCMAVGGRSPGRMLMKGLLNAKKPTIE